MFIREYKPSDWQQLVVIATALEGVSFHWPPDKLRTQIDHAATRTFVVVENESSGLGGEIVSERIMAFACFVDMGQAIEIPVLATHPQFHHQGWMKHLLNAVDAQYYHTRELWLEVHEGNMAARNLYRSLGFVESGRRVSYYRDGSAAILCNRFSGPSPKS